MKTQRGLVLVLVWGLAEISVLSGCASLTGRKRVLIGAGLGISAGAVGGALLSPNEESRALNALVFGLSGALAGGLIALLTESKSEVPKASSDLKDQELTLDKTTREFQVLPNQQLPNFLKERIHPLVIEEFVEADSVSEDGTLHEPHKAYRVKRPSELFAKPVQISGDSKK